jgi:hypothetical protein
MGQWVNGQVYGLHAKGKRYSLYVDGKTLTNEPIVQLATDDNGNRLPTYVPSAPTADVCTRGKATLAAGECYVAFSDAFRKLVDDPQELSITVTPQGNTNGVYVTDVTADGFRVKENMGGQSSTSFSWMAAGTRKGYAQPEAISPEILSADFDGAIRGIMINDADSEASSDAHLWWDGEDVRFDAPPPHQPQTDVFTGARPQPNGALRSSGSRAQESAPGRVSARD